MWKVSEDLVWAVELGGLYAQEVEAHQSYLVLILIKSYGRPSDFSPRESRDLAHP